VERDLLIGTRFLSIVVLLFFAGVLTFYRWGKVRPKVFDRSRWLLVSGFVLLSLHMSVLFFLHIPGHAHVIVWALDLIAFLPAIPIFTYSEMNLLRAGQGLRMLRIVLISFVAICYVLIGIGWATGTLVNETDHSLSMSFIVAILLSVLCIVMTGLLHREFHVSSIRLTNEELEYRNKALKYTGRSMSYVTVATLSAPWLGASDSPIVHAIFGLGIIALMSWFVISFWLYGTNMVEVAALSQEIALAKSSSEKKRIEQMAAEAEAAEQWVASRERERVAAAVTQWELSCKWLDPGMTIEQALTQMGISARLLNTYLKRERQLEGYRQWITQLRINRAQTLMLQHPEYSTESIGEMCGYMDRSNFSRAFKAQVGISPRLWVQVQKMTT